MLVFLSVNMLSIFLFAFLAELALLLTLYTLFATMHNVLVFQKSQPNVRKYK